MYDGPVKGMPIIRTLYLSPLSVSTPCFIATNSAPKTEVSMVDCFFEIQIIGAKLQKIKNPVRERRVDLSPAWSLSTIIRRSMSLPSGGGMSVGMASTTWHVSRDGLYHITIELRPVILRKGRMVNVRVSRVKDES